jgi:hypothetical protein
VAEYSVPCEYRGEVPYTYPGACSTAPCNTNPTLGCPTMPHCPLRPQTDCHKHPKQCRVRGGVLSTTVEVPNPFKYPLSTQ